MTNPIATCRPRKSPSTTQITMPTIADGHVLAVQIGLSAFLDRGRDFLHLRRTRRCREHLPRGYKSINQRNNAASENQHKFITHSLCLVGLVEQISRRSRRESRNGARMPEGAEERKPSEKQLRRSRTKSSGDAAKKVEPKSAAFLSDKRWMPSLIKAARLGGVGPADFGPFAFFQGFMMLEKCSICSIWIGGKSF